MERNENEQPREMSGAEYHNISLDKNEKGNFLESLENSDRALIAYHKEGDSVKSAEIRAMRALTLRRLYKNTGDRTFLIDAKNQVMAAVEIARSNDNSASLSIPLFQLGKAHVELGEFREAQKAYEEAINTLSESPQNRKSVLADMNSNLEYVKLRLGDLSAEGRCTESILKIQEAEDATPHEKGVWIATGFMRLAEAFGSSNPDKARDYLSSAEEVINRDLDGLKVIKGDWEKLSQSF